MRLKDAENVKKLVDVGDAESWRKNGIGEGEQTEPCSADELKPTRDSRRQEA
jgi:hypothetical protein